MTIEGRPELDVDWQQEYQKQRKSRLTDVIYEYMEDDVPADEFVETVLDTIRECTEYHQSKVNNAKKYMDSISSIIPF
jgi:ATP-dependent Clp protease adapter protein ClpS